MLVQDYLSFPGLGIEPFHIDKVAFKIPIGKGIPVAWYGLLIVCGMILAVLCALFIAKKIEGIEADTIYDLALYVVIFGILGARAYYVIFDWSAAEYLVTDGNFLQNAWGTIYNCIAMWEGGLAIYGGVIAGIITAFIFAKVKKIHFLKLLDILVPCVLIGQIIGRWGNFINIEVYGAETTAFSRMGIHRVIEETGEILSETFVHPMFLYESLWNLVGLIIVAIYIANMIKAKKHFNGYIFCFYLIWYGFGRMILEGMRDPEFNLRVGSTPIMVSQLVGFISLICGIIILVILIKRNKNQKNEEYTPIMATAEVKSTVDCSTTEETTEINSPTETNKEE